jgi:hypothetical protein
MPSSPNVCNGSKAATSAVAAGIGGKRTRGAASGKQRGSGRNGNDCGGRYTPAALILPLPVARKVMHMLYNLYAIW